MFSNGGTELGSDKLIKVEIAGPIWFIGWLFTAGFAGLSFGKILLALAAWPYFLGKAFAA